MSEIERLNMQTKNLAEEKLKQLKELFPNAVTEIVNDEGEVVPAIDKDTLMQEISSEVVEGNKERYQFTWPNKREAVLAANAPTSNTLRPCREESVNFDETENLYIEGDNLEVLKQLQETYLGKVKMIYIDPPYNTGKDFVYKDDFKSSINEYTEASGQYDDDGNRLESNPETHGRFHTDWLNMMYPRLKLARNLLSEDGVIFISIDENEQMNLKKIGDEVFGERNFVFDLIRKTKSTTNDAKTGINTQHEVCLVYAKDFNLVNLLGGEKDLERYSNPDEDPNGDWISGDPSAKSGNMETGYFAIENPYTGKVDYPPKGMYWRFSKNTMQKHIDYGTITFKKEHKQNERGFIYKRYKKDLRTTKKTMDSLVFTDNKFMNQKATKELLELNLAEYFSYPKGVGFIKDITLHGSDEDSIVLDFFAGSSTTAHAVMSLNAKDGGNRKFIMVQLPEKTDEKSEAYKAGYENIADIGKERIRRAGQKILEENKDKEGIENLDFGFRVLKLDSSNMKDVYYTPEDTDQNLLDLLEDNIKEDRTSEDLLFQVMLELGVPLSSTIEKEEIAGKEILSVEGGFLVACFDKDMNEETVKAIAERKPYYAVFRDSSMANDSVATNFDQIFESISPETIRRVV